MVLFFILEIVREIEVILGERGWCLVVVLDFWVFR